MKSTTGRPAALLAGAILALAAAPHAASAQAVGSYMRPGARPAGPVGQVPTPQPAPMRPGPFFGRPNSGGTFGSQEPGPQGLPFRRTQGNGGASYPTIVVTGQQTQFGYSGRPTQAYGSNGYGSNGYGGNEGGGNVYSDQYYHGGRNNYYGNGGLPPVGPANGFFNNLTPPVGPANGFFSAPSNNYIYSNNAPIGAGGGPPLLGGYYYGNYSDSASGADSYPSVYSAYAGFPQYIDSPGVIVNGQPYVPAYDAPYQSFSSPTYSVTYNNINYYVNTSDRAQQLGAGGDGAREALKNAYPADSYQAAFGDIARAWTDGDVKPLRRHIRDTDTRISVSLNRKYSYSIASGDFVQITRDALDRLHTVSFEFTHIRKAKNGDVTAFGKHVYRAADAATAESGLTDGDTVPFDQSGGDSQAAPSDTPGGDEKTVYVSYTLRRQDGRWNIIAIDSSDTSLVPSDAR